MQTNTVMCTICKRWIHKRYSGVRGKLSLVVDGFRCNRCDGKSPISHWILHMMETNINFETLTWSSICSNRIEIHSHEYPLRAPRSFDQLESCVAY